MIKALELLRSRGRARVDPVEGGGQVAHEATRKAVGLPEGEPGDRARERRDELRDGGRLAGARGGHHEQDGVPLGGRLELAQDPRTRHGALGQGRDADLRLDELRLVPHRVSNRPRVLTDQR
jgi:hypothetical protein